MRLVALAERAIMGGEMVIVDAHERQKQAAAATIISHRRMHIRMSPLDCRRREGESGMTPTAPTAGPSSDPFTAQQRFYWRVALELKLRKSNGDAFQDFFSTVMGHLHGDDFVRVRPYGARGDKGCDGYLLSSGQLFQCYGALAGEKKQVNTLTSKMKDDFAKAKEHLAAILKEWHMVHNRRRPAG